MERQIRQNTYGTGSYVYIASTYGAAEKSAREKITSTTLYTSTIILYSSLTRPSLPASEGVASETTVAIGIYVGKRESAYSREDPAENREGWTVCQIQNAHQVRSYCTENEL